MLLWRFSLFFVTCHLRQNPLLFYLIAWHGVLHIEAVEAAAAFARHYGSTGADIGAEADVVNDHNCHKLTWQAQTTNFGLLLSFFGISSRAKILLSYRYEILLFVFRLVIFL